MDFLKKILILIGDEAFKKGVCFFYFFGLLSKAAIAIFPIFCVIVDDNRAYHLSYIFFLKKDMLDCRGLSVRFCRFLAFSPKQL